MKTKLRRILGSAAALGMTTTALAHPGHHETVGLADSLQHMLSHADHLAPFLAVMAIVLVLRSLSRRNRSDRR